jgi:hypothetical protein
MVLAAVLVAVNSFFWIAQGSFALPRGLIDRFFGPNMIRSEAIVESPLGEINDFRLDRGVITATGRGWLTLRERDGTVVTVRVARRARIVGPDAVADVRQLQPPMRVLVVRKGTGPVNLIQVEQAQPPPGAPGQ